MHKSAIEIISGIVVLITVVDFVFDAFWQKNIVSTIRKMIRQTDNTFEAVQSQKRVTYFSIVFKLLSLCLLIFASVFLNPSWTGLILYMLAISIFIVNITALVNRAMN